jgi:hypothetical protein
LVVIALASAHSRASGEPPVSNSRQMPGELAENFGMSQSLMVRRSEGRVKSVKWSYLWAE